MNDILPSSELDSFNTLYWCSAINPGYVFSTIVDQLHAGRAIIANTPQHSFIIYGYVPNTQTFVVHNGWHRDDQTMLSHSHDYFDCSNKALNESIQMCIIAEFNSVHHEHSYYYRAGDDSYCFCGDEVGVYPYIHHHYYNLANGPHHQTIFVCEICGKIG